MAFTNKTANYELPQWKLTDPFQMEDFNEAFDKIDTAISNCGPKIVAGTYVGDGSESRIIPLGFTPTAVLLLSDTDMNSNNFIYNGIALAERPLYAVNKCKYEFFISEDHGPAIEITTNGFKVAKKDYTVNGQYFYAYTNINNYRYRYIAIA